MPDLRPRHPDVDRSRQPRSAGIESASTASCSAGKPRTWASRWATTRCSNQDGKIVAATTPLMSPQQPTAWTTYISTANAEETAKKVTEAGGQVHGAADAGHGSGHDGRLRGSGRRRLRRVAAGQDARAPSCSTSPNSLSWNELATRDMDARQELLHQGLPWTAKSNEMPDGSEYVEWQIDGSSIGGGMTMGAAVPAPGAAALAGVLRGRQYRRYGEARTGAGRQGDDRRAMDIPQGRFAVLTDPQGAAFAVIQLAQLAPPARTGGARR